MTTINYTITPSSIVLTVDGVIHKVRDIDPNFRTVRTALFEGRTEDAVEALSVEGHLAKWARGAITFENGQFKLNGRDLPAEINDRVLEMAKNNESPESLLAFYERLAKNPSYRSVTQLYGFLKNQGIPLTEKGTFLAYKSVRSDYKDIHSGTITNTPGTTISMPRNQISDDPDLACHVGLHVGALGYVSTFGGSDSVILVCEVDPEHVVCVPNDHSAQKMRVCEYKVIGHWNGLEMSSTVEKDELVDGPTRMTSMDTEEDSDDFYEDDEQTPDVDADPNDDLEPADIDINNLMGHTLAELRTYASKTLKIVGASKIPGGKTALIRKMKGALR